MSSLQVLVAKGWIRQNLSNAVTELNRWTQERQNITPNFRYFAVGGLAAALQGRERATTDIDVRMSLLGDAEKLSIQAHANWELWSSAKKPHQIKAYIKFSDGKVKINAVAVEPTDYSVFTKHKLITNVEGISIANPALLAIIKLQTLARRGNVVKLPTDYADLMWCLKESQNLGLVIPQEALKAGFTATWTEMYTRLRKIVDKQQVDALTELLEEMGINPQDPPAKEGAKRG